MSLIRIFGSSLTTGTPFVAVIADETDPMIRSVVGGGDMQSMVDHRWQMYTEKGLPADHKTLLTTLGGSHVTVTDWEPAGDDMTAAVAAAQRILTARKPLPGVLIVP